MRPATHTAPAAGAASGAVAAPPAAAAPTATSPPPVVVLSVAALRPHEGPASDAYLEAADALAEALLGSGVVVLELAREDALAVDAALLAAGAFFDSPRAAKQEFAALPGSLDGWREDRTGGESLGCRIGGTLEAPPAVAPWAARATAALTGVARVVLAALSRAPVLRLQPGSGGLGRLMQDAPLARSARGASLLVASRHGAASAGPPPPPPPGEQAERDTHVGLLSIVATQGATLRVQLPGNKARSRLIPGPCRVAVVTGETLHYATAGGVRPVPHSITAAAAPATGAAPAASLVLRVHGDPSAQLPAGSGIFRACDDVAAFERLLLSPPPPTPPSPPHAGVKHESGQRGGSSSAGGELVRLPDGTSITITADVVTVNGAAAGGGGGGVNVSGAAGSFNPGFGHRAGGTPPDGHVNLVVLEAASSSHERHEMRFLVPLSTPLHTLLDAYCTRSGVAQAKARFAVARGGARLNPSLTVRAAGLRERDVIVMERTD